MVTVTQNSYSARPIFGQINATHLAIGRKLSLLRHKHGYTQKQFAEKTCISVSYIGKLEAGIGIDGLTYSTMTALAKGLKVSEAELISLSDLDYERAEHYAAHRARSILC